MSRFPVTRTIKNKLSGEERLCPECGTKMNVVTTEIRKFLEFIPAHFEVVEENKYAVEEFVVIDGKKVSKFDLEPVVCLNTGVRYDNNKIAMQETGVNSGAIKRNCRGFTKCAGKDENGKKLVWKFAKDVE